MYTVTKELTWSSAHRLIGYQGLCRHLHGHDYRALLTFTGNQLDNRSILIDFKDIKRKCRKWIRLNWEHATLVAKEDPTLIHFLKAEKNRHFITESSPTAEWIAKYLFDLIDQTLIPPDKGVALQRVTVLENAQSSASYERIRESR